jgi:AGZA family xanthine/uracil permease-like MFS transporter
MSDIELAVSNLELVLDVENKTVEQKDDMNQNIEPSNIEQSDKLKTFQPHKDTSSGSMSDLIEPQFYNRSRYIWIPHMFEILFEIEKRGTTIKAEIYFGLIHFVSCFYVLAVIPGVMAQSGYSKANIFVVTALSAGFGSIIGGFVSNLPFPIAPPTAIALFYQARLQLVGATDGSAALVLSGFIIIILGIKPIATFLRHLIPVTIQVGTSVGIGLITSLAGAIEVGMIETGDNTILQFGALTPAIIITLFGFILIPILNHYSVKGPFACTIVVCSLLGWGVYNTWPSGVVSVPSSITTFDFSFDSFQSTFVVLVFELVFLYFLYIHGLISSLSRLADLQEKDGSTPRMYSLYVVCGVMTVASGALNGIPVLLSPEGA